MSTERQPLDHLLNQVAWEVVPHETKPEGRYATHSGELSIMGHRFKCYRLNTGEAVFDADDVHAFLGLIP